MDAAEDMLMLALSLDENNEVALYNLGIIYHK